MFREKKSILIAEVWAEIGEARTKKGERKKEANKIGDADALMLVLREVSTNSGVFAQTNR